MPRLRRCRLNGRTQRRRPRDAPIVTATALRRVLQRMIRPLFAHHDLQQMVVTEDWLSPVFFGLLHRLEHDGMSVYAVLADSSDASDDTLVIDVGRLLEKPVRGRHKQTVQVVNSSV